MTGASFVAAEIAVKRLEVTRDLMPGTHSVAMIVNPTFAGSETEIAEVHAAGRVLGMQTRRLAASTPGEIDTANLAMRSGRCSQTRSEDGKARNSGSR